MKYKTLQDVRARITTSWSHHRCKFKRLQYAEVSTDVIGREYLTRDGTIAPARSYVSKKKQTRAGQLGQVLAVSCCLDGRIRNNTFAGGQSTRMFTRYYIRFSDGEILGYDSHHLRAAFDLREPR